jgi:hypothetical protein
MCPSAEVLLGKSHFSPLGDNVFTTTFVLGGIRGWSPSEPVHPDHEESSALMEIKYSPTRPDIDISSELIFTGTPLGLSLHSGTTAVALDAHFL